MTSDSASEKKKVSCMTQFLIKLSVTVFESKYLIKYLNTAYVFTYTYKNNGLFYLLHHFASDLLWGWSPCSSILAYSMTAPPYNSNHAMILRPWTGERLAPDSPRVELQVTAFPTAFSVGCTVLNAPPSPATATTTATRFVILYGWSVLDWGERRRGPQDM